MDGTGSPQGFPSLTGPLSPRRNSSLSTGLGLQVDLRLDECRADVLLADDVLASVHRLGLVPGDLHCDVSRDAGAIHVAGGRPAKVVKQSPLEPGLPARTTPHHTEVVDLASARSGVTDLRRSPHEDVGQVMSGDDTLGPGNGSLAQVRATSFVLARRESR